MSALSSSTTYTKRSTVFRAAASFAAHIAAYSPEDEPSTPTTIGLVGTCVVVIEPVPSIRFKLDLRVTVLSTPVTVTVEVFPLARPFGRPDQVEAPTEDAHRRVQDRDDHQPRQRCGTDCHDGRLLA